MSLFDEDIEAEEGVTQDCLCDPRSMLFCLGHDQQEQLFLNLFHQDVFPHALIFSGLEGIGKTTMAFRLAKFLLKHGGDKASGLFGDALPESFTSLDLGADDPVFSRVASGGHADLLHIAREYNSSTNKLDSNLKVDALRKIEPFLRKTASEGGWRIVVVEDADTMNRNAQNAILKILEEPPKKVLIILVAHSTGALIPTIRSRARMINFEPLSQSHIRDLLERQGLDLSAKDIETLSIISKGSIGRALKLMEEDGLETLDTLLDHIGASGQKIHALSNSLGAKSHDKQYRVFSFLFTWTFRYLVFLKANGDTNLPLSIHNNYLEAFFKKSSLIKLISLSDNLNNHFERIEFSNLDRSDAIRSAFLMIENESVSS